MAEHRFPIDLSVRSKRRTICEVLREIHVLASQDGKSEIVERANEAHDMAKRMDSKLRGYKADWDAEMWEDNAGGIR
ncbi:MAG: hypothetical protein KF723_22130 [Rhizobiaceae bacterium]|nr:hypothetical protein [Rhizobiaceae bacterium]